MRWRVNLHDDARCQCGLSNDLLEERARLLRRDVTPCVHGMGVL
jgi:hypothetical protein